MLECSFTDKGSTGFRISTCKIRPSLVGMAQQGANSRGVADDAHTMRMEKERQADPATRLMVDEMILDYLLYMAAKVILQDREARREGVQPQPQACRADLHLSMVDGR